MSLASVWAADIAAKDATVATSEAAIPPQCDVGGMRASVTRDGGLHLNKEALLTPADAIALGNWIVETFG